MTKESAERFVLLAQPTRSPTVAGEEALYEARTDCIHMLSAEQSRVLGACEGIGAVPLDAMAAVVVRRLRGDQRLLAGVHTHLQSFVSWGLLVPADVLCAELSASTSPEAPPPPLRILGVVTANRTACLRACVESHVRAIERSGREARIVIACGSRDPDVSAQDRAAVASIAVGRGTEIAWSGRAEREAYAEKLAARAGIPLEVAAFTLWPNDELFPNNTGSNRNALLLDSVGEMSVQIDDDAMGRFGLPPEHRSGLALLSGDPSEMWFPGPNDPVIPRVAERDEDVFSIHERMLGRTLAGAIAAEGGPSLVDVNGVNAAFYSRAKRPDARIRTTQMGAAGDSGAGSTLGYLLLRGANRGRLLVSEQRYRHALTRRILVRASSRAAVAVGQECMAPVLGLDGRSILPPFPTVERAADNLFGSLLWMTARGSLIGYLPRVFSHEPPVVRDTTLDVELSRAGFLSTNSLLAALLNAAADLRASHTAEALQDIGRLLSRLAAKPEEARPILRATAMRALGMRIMAADRLLAECNRAPLPWARDVDRLMGVLRDALVAPTLGLSSEIVSRVGVANAEAVFLRLARSYGEMLSAWPAMWEAARVLAAEGMRPSRWL